MRNRRWSPRWIAASASTIVSELISSMNDVTDVNGMLKQLVGRRALQELRVAAAVEEVRRDERTEEQRLRREEQPDRELGVADAGVRRRVVAVEARLDLVLVVDLRWGRRPAPSVVPPRSSAVAGSIAIAIRPNTSTSTPTGEQPPVLEHEAVAHDRQAEREHERPVRRRRHVDVVRRRRGRARLVDVAGVARPAASPAGLRRPRCTCGARTRRGASTIGIFGEVVLGRRRRGRSTRACARPTGRAGRDSARVAS